MMLIIKAVKNKEAVRTFTDFSEVVIENTVTNKN
jgi:hypothetical protein